MPTEHHVQRIEHCIEVNDDAQIVIRSTPLPPLPDGDVQTIEPLIIPRAGALRISLRVVLRRLSELGNPGASVGTQLNTLFPDVFPSSTKDASVDDENRS